MAKARDYESLNGIPITKLHLDSENPRHDPIRDEPKIIAQLVKAEQVMSLVKDIARRGGVSPLERIGVVEIQDNPGHYTVGEGNRRLCALKLLHDPRKAPTIAQRTVIEALKAGTSLPTKFEVVVFKSRDAARQWIELRHLGAQAGAGTRPWNTTQKARFVRGTSPDHLALAVLDRAEKGGWIDQSTRRRIGITTLTRYLGNPVVRAALGLGSRSELVFTHDAAEVDAALKQFLTEALPSVGGSEAKVNSRTKAADWKVYGQSLHARGIAPTTLLPAPVTAPPPTAAVAPPARGRPLRHPSDRPYVIPPDFQVRHGDKPLQRLIRELKSLKPDEDFEYACNYLTRAVIERIMVLFAKKKQFYQPKMQDRMLTQKCHDALEADGVARTELKNMRTAYSNDDAHHSLDTLGAAVHGASLPTRRTLIAVWDNWEPVLQHMLARL
jgi:hypothetical protein